jgi:hypothetical protein
MPSRAELFNREVRDDKKGQTKALVGIALLAVPVGEAYELYKAIGDVAYEAYNLYREGRPKTRAVTLVMTLTTRKSILFVFFAATLGDTFYAPRGSTPGYEGALFLSWALFTRLFLPTPSYKHICFSAVCAAACVASNHGLLNVGAPLRSVYLYLFCALLIAWWEKIVGFFQAENVGRQT